MISLSQQKITLRYYCLHWTQVHFVTSFLPIGFDLICSYPLFALNDSTTSTITRAAIPTSLHSTTTTKKKRTDSKKKLKNEIIDFTDE
jgi:hypothetical protein